MKRASFLRLVVVLLLSLLSFAVLLSSSNVQARSDATQPNSLPGTICFVSNDQVSCVDRVLPANASTADQVRSLVEAMLTGPTSAEKAGGIRSALPDGTRLKDVLVTDADARIDLILPDAFLKSLVDAQVEDINEQFSVTFTPFSFKRIDVNARDTIGEYVPISQFLAPIVIPHKASATPLPVQGEGPGVRVGLSGKTVFVSAGHGWKWTSTQQQYRAQRPVYPQPPYPSGEGIVEDFNNAEAVNQYLLPYLRNAGADAWTVRERDMNPNMIIVDDASANFSTQGAWTTGPSGYANGYHSTLVHATATATATWSFTPPAAGTYAVYVWYPYPVVTRTVEAHYFVEHAGGTTPITITQAHDGNNWRYLGSYPFYGGQVARVRLTNQSSTPNLTAIADAVRIGGGMADTPAPDAPAISGKPRWEEQAWTYARWVGLPDVASLNDVIVRPIYSEWEKESGEDAVYISWHTNGYNGYNTVARGTESYIHSFQPTPGSDVLQSFIHTELLNDIHNGWDPTWPDRGERSQDLGELRLLSSMPGVLIENGYHDNPQDVEAMKDPRFNQLSARAIYHGLVRYWHSIDPNVPLTFLPEPPTRLIVRNSGAGQVTLSWQPGPTDGAGPLGDAATSYRVYTSADGFGWGNPVDVVSTAYTLTGLSPNQLIFVRVTSINAGGESLPTPVLAARSALAGLASTLIVYGFDRIDRYGDIRQNDPPEGYSRRMFLDRINRFDYVIQHADAITLPFDSALHAAVSNSAIGLNAYTIADWLAGEEQAPFTSLNTNDQNALISFLNNGGALFISGSEIGYELQGTPFYANTLHASFVADSANTYAMNPQAGGIFAGLGTINFDDGTHGTYNVDYADVFNPINDSSTALVYNTGGPAAIQFAAGPCTRLVYSGVPFETIYPAATRRAAMSRIINDLDTCLPSTIDTIITSPPDNTFVNGVPNFNGEASSNATSAQVSIKRPSDSTFYNGASFVPGLEIWLAATGAAAWQYALPALNDGAYALRARAIAPGPITDTTPAAITFTLDTIAPATPTLITPTNSISIVAVAPTFQWTGGGNPDRFEVELDGVTHNLNGPALSATIIVTDGLHHWRVRAFDAANNVSGWSTIGTFSTSSIKTYLPIVLKNYAAEALLPAPACSNVLANGGFETGNLSGWSSLSQNPPPVIVATPVFSGSFAARVGASDVSSIISGYSSVQQAVTIPTTALTATLSFERYRYSGDASDLQYVAVLSGTTVLDYLVYDRVNDPNWQSGQFDLLPYIGQSINLRFGVYNNGTGGSTGLVVDDVMLRVCVP
jgi:N-acetylmuramoyl-L-alanine amidase